MIWRCAFVPLLRGAFVVAMVSALAACAGHPQKPVPQQASSTKHERPVRKPWKPLGPYTPGGLYAPGIADGAPDVPPDVANLPEPVPHAEPLSRYGNRTPYTVLGKTYKVLPSAKGYDERGVASWYGTKFDGRATSNFEQYDVYQFSAAHRTLPLPSYARVTNLENGRSVIVRVNDRGPFHDGRLIDLSYAAAVKLGVNIHGTAKVEVQGIDPGGAPMPNPALNPVTSAAIATTAATVPSATKLPAKSATTATMSPPKTVLAMPTAPSSATTTLADTQLKPRVVVDALPAIVPPASTATAMMNRAQLATPTQVLATPATPPVAVAPTPTPAAQTVIGRPEINPATQGFLQLASYSNRANAETMLQRVQKAGVEHAELVSVEVAGKTLWRVHVGPVTAIDAEAIADHLDTLGFGHPPFFKD